MGQPKLSWQSVEHVMPLTPVYSCHLGATAWARKRSTTQNTMATPKPSHRLPDRPYAMVPATRKCA